MDFAVPADHRIKLKECEKKDKYPDLARELKKMWNKKVTIIPNVICAFDTVTKGLVKDLEIRGRVETIQNYSFAESSQNTEKSPGDLGDLLLLKLP